MDGVVGRRICYVQRHTTTNSGEYKEKKNVFPDYDKERMADVTGEQRMFTPKGHSIQPY